MPPSATRPSGLSRERILDAARAIVGREGLDALSMRRLAQELDVWPMSIYRYFRNKDELLDAMAAIATEGIAVPSARASWRSQLRSLLSAAHEALAGDPSWIGSRLPSAFLTPGTLKLSEAGVRILESAGLDAAEAASAWRTLWSYTFGFATFRFAPTSGEVIRRMRTAIAALPDEEYPTLLTAVDELAAVWADEDEFDQGLQRLLDGLEVQIGARVSGAGAGRSR
jgi:TetR/AcrR family transcriptional regulator, tetracycline repressor protein